MLLPVNAKKLIDLIISNGHQAYAVGGFVRDTIMNRVVGDIDIASSATPLELEDVLLKENIKFVETGIKHGTITAIIDNIPYEITTFREDGDYKDNRHPEDVTYVRDIKADLSRRDFTINAIAYNDFDGIVDEFDGIGDIDRKIIRCVGDADTRFKEDALRIMRAIRFASVLGFDIEESTKKAIFDNKNLLLNVASERIFVELKKLLMGDNVESVLTEYRDVIAVVIPELIPTFDCEQNSKWHIYDVYTHIVKSVAISKKVDYIRLALLFHDIGKPACKRTDELGFDHFKGHPQKSAEIALTILKRLKASNECINKVIKLIEIHDFHIKNDRALIKKWMRTYGVDIVYDYIDIRFADVSTHNLDLVRDELDILDQVKPVIKSILDNNEPYRISDLAINGNDLILLGYSGKSIAEKLEDLIDIVSSNPELNTKSQLLEIAK